MLKFFRVPFALSGTRTPVPDAADPSGFVSYIEGYGPDYQRAKTDVLSKNIERDKMNEIFFDVTNAVAELQSQGIPDFITSALNGGSPYSYAINAMVRYSGQLYLSLVNANTALPTDPAKWAVANTEALRARLADTAAANGAGMVGFVAGTAYPASTVGADLNAPRPVNRGGTGATTPGGALTNLGLINIAAEIAVSSTTVLNSTALGKGVAIYNNGTNYTVTLPPAAPVGSIIQVRINKAATGVYAVHGNDAPIDGETARGMWAGEVALLLREASNWTKIAGRSIPFIGGMQRLTNQTGITLGSYTQVNFTSTFGDPSGLNLSYVSGSGNFLCRRKGNYVMSATLSISADTTTISGAAAEVAIVKNAATPTITPSATNNARVGTSVNRFMVNVGATFQLNPGDGVGVVGRTDLGTNPYFESNGTSIAPTLTYAEVPTW